jgi:hypothetical protein
LSRSTEASEPIVLEYARPARPPLAWPILACGFFLCLALLLQAMFLPCLCGDSIVKVKFAMYLDVLFVARVVVARICHQENRDWLIYVAIVVSSAFWIEYVLYADWIRAAYAFVGVTPS